jgi:hypothetical protein
LTCVKARGAVGGHGASMRENSVRSIAATLTVRQSFAIDAIGAAVTAAMLAVVLPALEPYLGMPPRVLVPLCFVALGFAVYSSSCFALRASPRWLLVIAAANAAYCLCTLTLVVVLWNTLTPLGVAYFLGEVALILGLVALEVHVASRERVRVAPP